MGRSGLGKDTLEVRTAGQEPREEAGAMVSGPGKGLYLQGRWGWGLWVWREEVTAVQRRGGSSGTGNEQEGRTRVPLYLRGP